MAHGTVRRAQAVDAHLELLLRADGHEGDGACVLCELDRRHADAAGSRVDQHLFLRPYATDDVHELEGRQPRLGNGSCLFPRERGRLTHRSLDRQGDIFGVATARDQCEHLVANGKGAHALAKPHHCARALETQNLCDALGNGCLAEPL